MARRHKPRINPIGLLFRAAWWLIKAPFVVLGWAILKLRAKEQPPAAQPHSNRRAAMMPVDDLGLNPNDRAFLEQSGPIGATPWFKLVRKMLLDEIHSYRMPAPGAYRHGRLMIDRIPLPTPLDEIDPVEAEHARVVGYIQLRDTLALHLVMPCGEDVYVAIEREIDLDDAADPVARNVIWLKTA